MKTSRVRLAVFVLISCMMFTACGNDKAEGSDLVGKWEASRHRDEIIDFIDDSTYVYTTPGGESASGSYKVEGDGIQMVFDAPGLGDELNKISGFREFTLEGDTLSFFRTGAGAEEYVKIR